MKTFLKIVSTLSLAALVLVSCRTEELAREAGGPVTVHFTAGAIPSKTAFGTLEDGRYPCLWSDSDTISLALDYDQPQTIGVSASEDGRTAYFSMEFSSLEPGASHQFQTLSPASAVLALSASRKAWHIAIPSVQTPLPASPDESAQIISAMSASWQNMPSAISLGFSHVTAYGRMSLSNLDLGDAQVSSIEVTSSKPLAGRWYLSLPDGSMEEDAVTGTIVLKTSSTRDVWFACAPCDMSMQTLRVRVYTDAGMFEKTVTVPQGLSFASGKISRFAVDFTGVSPQQLYNGFSLVSSVSDLNVGDEILVVDVKGEYALGSQVSGKKPHRNNVSVSVSDSKIDDAGDATVLVLGSGSSSGTWSLMDGSQYLAAQSSGNYLNVSSSLNAYSSWSIDIASDGVATIKAQSGASQYIRYNPQKPRFSCYKSTSTNMRAVSIYLKGSGASSADPGDDPLLSRSLPGLWLSAADSREYVPGTDQLVRRYDDGVLSFVIMDPSTNEQIEISGYDSSLPVGAVTDISMKWRKGRTVVASDTYTVTLLRDNGPMVWLSLGSGLGFILMK